VQRNCETDSLILKDFLQNLVTAVCLTALGNECIFPFKDGKTTMNGCRPSESLNFSYHCPTELDIDGQAVTWEQCQPNCPTDCPPDQWKCDDKCIDKSEPCGKMCIQSKTSGADAINIFGLLV